MKNYYFFFTIATMVVLAACTNSHSKKIIIMASGKVNINEKKPEQIKLEPGTQHNEAIINFSTADKITLVIEKPGGTENIEVVEDGLYLLNLKSDTLIGGYQVFGEAAAETSITQEKFQAKIDSLQQLLAGQNITAERKNFWILPGKIQKISTSTDAIVVGPYNKLPNSIEPVNGKTPDVFKFITNKDGRELLKKTIEIISK